jgi:DNA-binding transcriptional regulator GbsR (MarR family)
MAVATSPPPTSSSSSAVSTVRDSFVQLWGALGPFWGVSPTTARIFGWMMSQPEGADQEEIMQALELSRGAVSMACRELREWGLIYPEKAPGSRRIVYRPETDLEKITRHVVQIRKRREWDPILEHLRDWIPMLEGESSPEAKMFLERLQAIEALVVMADGMADFFLGGGTMGSFGLKLFSNVSEHSARSRRNGLSKLSQEES